MGCCESRDPKALGNGSIHFIDTETLTELGKENFTFVPLDMSISSSTTGKDKV